MIHLRVKLSVLFKVVPPTSNTLKANHEFLSRNPSVSS